MAVRPQSRAVRPRPNAFPFLAQLPYDTCIFEPELYNNCDDVGLTKFLLDHHDTLLPSSAEQQALTVLVNRLCETIDNLILDPTGLLAGELEEIRVVGSFKSGTWLAGHNTADVVVVTRTLPTAEVLKNIQTTVEDRLNASTSSERCIASIQFYGFSVTSGSAIVRVFISTNPTNIPRVDANIHINPSSQKSALSAIRQIRWMEENTTHTSVKVLIRLMKDLRRRYKGFQYMSSWLITLLATYSVLKNPANQPLQIGQAFRRLLQLLASGILLPGHVALVDPCEPGAFRLNTCLSLTEQDELCCTAQTLLRALLHGAHEVILTFDECAEGSSCDQFSQLVKEKTGVSVKWSESIYFDAQDCIIVPGRVPTVA